VVVDVVNANEGSRWMLGVSIGRAVFVDVFSHTGNVGIVIIRLRELRVRKFNCPPRIPST
jgi:hypothetical protein